MDRSCQQGLIDLYPLLRTWIFGFATAILPPGAIVIIVFVLLFDTLFVAFRLYKPVFVFLVSLNQCQLRSLAAGGKSVRALVWCSWGCHRSVAFVCQRLKLAWHGGVTWLGMTWHDMLWRGWH